jgi:methyl-accepting chemotaxis protein
MALSSMLRRIRVGPRLAAGFLVVLVLGGVAAGVAAFELQALAATIDRIVSGEAARLELAGELEKGVTTNLVRSQSVLLFQDEVIAKRIQADVVATNATLEETLHKLEAVTTSSGSRERFAAVADARTKYEAKLKQLMDAKSYGDDMNSLIRTELAPLNAAYAGAVHAFVDAQKASLAAARTDALTTVQRTRALVAALLAAGTIAAVGAALSVWRSVVPPLRAARAFAERIAGGDLTRDFMASGSDEIAELERSLARMQDALRSIAAELHAAGEGVLAASAQVATGSGDLSGRTEQQSSTLEQTAASLEELASTVRQNAGSASSATEQAASASRVAGEASELVRRAVETMAQIQRSAARIADITQVVDGISFQTNILALNAAVEAARAGAEGRGFAVVASEVRSLAQRSASAAREIQELIGSSVASIEAGAALVRQAGSTMDSVLSSVRGVNDGIGQIAHATSEQSAGIGQVSQAMADLEKVTQHNAELVSLAARAADDLRGHAERLSKSYAFFTLREEARVARPVPAARVRAPVSAPPRTPAPVSRASQPALAAHEEWREF